MNDSTQISPLVSPRVAAGSKPPKLPKALPDWIHAEFGLHSELWRLEELRSAVFSTPGNKALESVWRSLRKCNQAYDKRVGTATKSHLLPLGRLMQRAVKGFNSESVHRLSASERRTIATKVQRATRDLLSALDRLKGLGPDDAMREAEMAFFKSLVKVDPLSWESGPAFSDGISAVFDHADLFLHAIGAAGEQWGNRKPTLAKPKIKYADRIYFFRVMTKFFVARYGRPLYQNNITLAAVIFPDYPEVTTTGLAKITTHERTPKS